jgi:predicted HD phosphohydrolase
LECDAFASNPHAEDAKKLRTWDDIGKRPAWFCESTAAAMTELRALMARVSSVHQN